MPTPIPRVPATLIGVFCFMFFGLNIISLSNGQANQLPTLHVRGTHYEVGRTVGETFKERIQSFVQRDTTLNKDLLPFYNTTKGKDIFNQLFQFNMGLYPLYFQELQGLADGSNVPFYQIVLLNLRPEILGMLQISKSNRDKTTLEKGCSDIHIFKENIKVFGHNEDADSLVQSTAYLLHVEIKEGQSVENFTAYTYPGVLPGIAFGFNEHLAVSMNAVYPKEANIAAGRIFINRDFLTAKSIPDLISKAANVKRAFGFSANVGQLSDGSISNIEFAPDVFAEVRVNGNYSHFNNYKELADKVQAFVGISSAHRSTRADQMPAPQNAADILQILGDTNDSQYPIYRNGVAPDTNVATTATGLFDLVGKTLQIWLDNPKTSSSIMTLKMSSQ